MWTFEVPSLPISPAPNPARDHIPFTEESWEFFSTLIQSMHNLSSWWNFLFTGKLLFVFLFVDHFTHKTKTKNLKNTPKFTRNTVIPSKKNHSFLSKWLPNLVVCMCVCCLYTVRACYCANVHTCTGAVVSRSGHQLSSVTLALKLLPWGRVSTYRIKSSSSPPPTHWLCCTFGIHLSPSYTPQVWDYRHIQPHFALGFFHRS